MSYEVIIDPAAQRVIRKLTPALQERMESVIPVLEENPRPPGCLKLTDCPEWRIRVGKYRVLYLIDDEARIVVITDVGPRGSIYREG
ncbi:type II toxin-antitoxin system RelE/ParE family toxin [bacterium]|nr:type II toxin-antitoxin system RelE/ParE family toxin [bacterium]